jgi:hypothetical protein
MGFDESQVAALFGPHAAQTMISGTSTNTTPDENAGTKVSINANLSLIATSLEKSVSNSVLTSTAGNTPMLSVLTHADPSSGTLANPLSKLPNATINSSLGLQGLNTPSSPLPIDTSLQVALAAVSTQSGLAGALNASYISPTVSNPGSVNHAGNLAELLASEGVDAQSLQLNISGGLKNSSAQVANMGNIGNASLTPTSTLAILNMSGSQLSEHAIAALQKEFNQLKGLDHSSAFDVNPSQDSSLLSSAQLNASDAANSGGSNPDNGAGDSSASNAQAASAGTAVNMAETYEKLSDQLTAELSKRMREQISQGQWKMKFALKPSTLGAVDVQLEMKDGKLAAVFQADNALTQNLLQHSSQQLKDNLKDLGLDQTYVQVDQQNGGQSQQNDQQNNAKNPFDPLNEAQQIAVAQDSTSVVDASMKVKNNDSLLDLMA